MYDFLRRPAWIVSHVLIAALLVALISLGLWQRSRWMDEQATAEAVEELASGPAVALDEVVDPGAGVGDVDEDVRFTRVAVTGRYDVAAEVAVLNRSRGGSPGAWVLTPLVLDDGSAVAVVRGWIPYDPAGVPAPFEGAEPPTGEVTVEGTVQLTQRRGSFGAVDPDEGIVDSLARVDLERFGDQLDVPLAPVWVALEQQEPAQAVPLPQPVELSDGDPSQNFSYMVQWWIFAAIAAIGYPLVLRAVARGRARGATVAPEEPGPADGDRPMEVLP